MRDIVKKIIEEKTFVLVFMNLKTEGDKVEYVYLLTRADRYSELQKASAGDEVLELDKYGTVILAGDGEVPSDADKRAIAAFMDLIEKKKAG